MATPAFAAWPANGTPVCQQPFVQNNPVIVSDGTGGMFVVWSDRRSGTGYRPYAQRLDGARNPVWVTHGLPIGSQATEIELIEVVSDGGQGAIVVWLRNENHLTAQKIDETGAPQWFDSPDGVNLNINATDPGVVVTPDGTGGVIVAWEEEAADWNIHAQRIDANGNVMWSAGGALVFDGAADETAPCIIADGSGGAFIAATSGTNIRAQRIYSSGALWSSSGTTLASGSIPKNMPAIAPDGSGGAYVAWKEGTASARIKAHRVDGAGIPVWGAAVPASSDPNYLDRPDIMADGSGNAVICWEREEGPERSVHAQKLDSYGALLWAANGVAVSDIGQVYTRPRLLPGGGSNVIVAFHTDDYLSAQAIDAAGGRVWTALVPVQVMTGDLWISPDDYDFASDGAGGLLATTMEDRGVEVEDLYAQAINSLGNVYAPHPVITAVDDVPDDQGGWVRLTIGRSDRDDLAVIEEPAERYDVWREIPDPALIQELRGAGAAAAADAAESTAPHGLSFVDLRGKRYIDAAPGAVFPRGVWELVGGFSAAQNAEYTFAAPTFADSSAAGLAEVMFVTTVHTTNPAVWFVGLREHGHSVDNIPPNVPTGMSVAYNTGGGNQLAWDTSPDDDFKYFRIYRSETPGFTPSPANYVQGTVDAQWLDTTPDGWKYNYKVAAVDMADNESAATGGSATGAGGSVVPLTITLEQNVPNPFNPSTSISFGMPAAGAVTLVVYDITGKRVRTLIDEAMPAGFRSVTWHGTDDAGNRVSSGVYFYRFEAGGATITKKMLLLK